MTELAGEYRPDSPAPPAQPSETNCNQGRIQGGGGNFWQSQFNFFTLYTMFEKNIFEIEF